MWLCRLVLHRPLVYILSLTAAINFDIWTFLLHLPVCKCVGNTLVYKYTKISYSNKTM